jgi:Zn ribbon nucleic-acid-binding protein
MRTAGTFTIALSLLLLGAGGARANLDDFARCLTRAGARFYGTSWCPHCAAQRRMFGTAFNDVAYVECSVNGTKDTTAECTQAGVTSYPTWAFRDDSRQTGELSLEQLASKTGCKYERGLEPQILDLPVGRSGVVKLPGAEGVEILEVP